MTSAMDQKTAAILAAFNSKPYKNEVVRYDAPQALTAAQKAQARENIGGFSRNIGEIVTSTIPLTDAGLHLLDGSVIQGNGIYSDFVTYIAGLYTADPTAAYFTDETTWQSSVTTYGVCGKFVYDSVNDTVRLPKLTGITEGTTDLTALGDLVQAGLPNITGGTKYLFAVLDQTAQPSGAIYGIGGNNYQYPTGSTGGTLCKQTLFDASRSSSIYGNSTTVQPQTIKTLVYIVIATSTKTEIQVDIDNVATDLNGKADTDLLNLTAGLANTICTTAASTVSSATSARPAVIVENYKNGSSWYRVYSDGWCEQGGYAPTGTTQTSFLKTFASNDYFLAISRTQNDLDWSVEYIKDRTISGFGYRHVWADGNNLTTVGSYWYACGYIS